MSSLEKILQNIYEDKKDLFDIKNWWEKIIHNIENILFLGEIDKDIIYISMLHQVKHIDGKILDLDDEAADNFYINNRLHQDLCPFAWTFWRIDMETQYIQVFTSFIGNPNKSPKENFALSHEQVCLYEGQNLLYEAHICKLDENDSFIFKGLITAVQYSKTNEITIANFNKKVFHNISKYFGVVNNKNFIDDKYIDTGKKEIILIPQRHDLIQIRNDIEVLSTLKGTSFDTLNFENSVIRKFSSYKDLHDYFYSLIDYINKNNMNLEISQQINSVTKLWQSNTWPIPIDSSNQESNKKLYTKYDLYITKYDNKIKLKAEVQEYGVCYTLNV